MRKYSIYIIRNTVNNKVYIGQTSQSVRERFNQHRKPSTLKQRGTYKIYNAMKKYGINKFYVETLESGISAEDIDAKERYYIEKYDSFKNGYNSTSGGDGKTIAKIEDVELFKKLYADKVEIKDIAKTFGVCEATVQRTAESIGLPKRVERVTKEYLLANKDTKTNIEMAEELGVSCATITRGFQKFDIERGTGCNNLKNKQNQIRLPKDRNDEFVSMWLNRGISLQTMSKRFGVRKEAILAWSKKLGLPQRRTLNNYQVEGQMTLTDYMKGETYGN